MKNRGESNSQELLLQEAAKFVFNKVINTVKIYSVYCHSLNRQTSLKDKNNKISIIHPINKEIVGQQAAE